MIYFDAGHHGVLMQSVISGENRELVQNEKPLL